MFPTSLDQVRDHGKASCLTLIHSKLVGALATGLILVGPSALAAEYDVPTAAGQGYPVQQSAAMRCPRCGGYHAAPSACPNCGPHVAPSTAPGTTAPGAASPSDQIPAADDSIPLPTDAMASNFGAASAPQSAAPFMIGDSFGAGGILVDTTNATATDIPTGGGTGPMKIADNSSPLPRCRAFLNYNYFSHAIHTSTLDSFGAPISTRNMSVNRYTFGWEQCFADSMFSVELRVPFASTLAFDQNVGQGSAQATQFGHLTGTIKALLYQTDTWALSTGLSINAPTSNNFRVFDTIGSIQTQQIQINDQSLHLQPFLGFLAAPNGRWFVQAFGQLDFDTRGNDLYVNGNGSTLQKVGTVQDQTLLFLDASIGYWAYRDQTKTRGITGIAPMIELHYTTTLQNADIVTNPSATITYGNLYNRLDVLNMTGGVSFMVGQRSFLTIAGVSPVKNFPNRFFNGEATVLYNYLF